MAALITVYGGASVDAGHARRKRRGVHGMFGVKDQASVQHLGDGRRRLLFGEHVIEVGGMGQVVARRDGMFAVTQPMKGGHESRHLGDETYDRIPIGLGVGHVAGRVKHAHRGDAGLKRVHRMAGFRQALDQVNEFVIDAAVMAQLVVKVGQFALRGQIALEQQPGRFFKTAFAGQRLHGDTAVLQTRSLAVNETNGRLGGGHVGKARPILDLTHSLPTLNQGMFRVRGCGGS